MKEYKTAISGRPVARKHFNLRELEYGAYPNDSDDKPGHDVKDLEQIENEHTKEWMGRTGYHPFRQAHWIMQLHNAERKSSGDAAAAFHEKVQATVNVELDNAHLVEDSHLGTYEFDIDFYEDPDMRLTAPWFSALSQGALLSAYTRLSNYHSENDTYRKHRDKIFNSFLRLKADADPWFATIDDGYYWAEEQPLDDGPPHTLNGFIYSVFGLYECWLATRSAASRRVLEAALTTVLENKELFRVPDYVSYYDLRIQVQFDHYHSVHIRQFRKLALMTGEQEFHRFADKLVRDAPRLNPYSPEPKN